MKRKNVHNIGMWLLLLLLLGLSACSSGGDVEFTDGDIDSSSDGDTESITDGDTNENAELGIVYYECGNGSNDGNPKKIDIVLRLADFAPSEQAVQWEQVLVTLHKVILQDVEHCGTQQGESLEPQQGDVRLDMATEEKEGLRLYPDGTQYCSLRLDMKDYFSFEARGRTPDGAGVSIVGTLPDVVFQLPDAQLFQTDLESWLLLLDSRFIMPLSDLEGAHQGTDGWYRFNSESNVVWMEKVVERIAQGFMLVRDLDEDGELDEEENTGENILYDGRNQQWMQSPEIQVQSEVNFGAVDVGLMASRELEIINVGEGMLTIYGMEISPSESGEFYIAYESSQPLIPNIPPNEYEIVTIHLIPVRPGHHEADLVIASNDPNQPLTHVRLHNECKGLSDVVVSPSSVDFGSVAIGNEVSRRIELMNYSSDMCTDLRIDGFSIEPEGVFEVVNADAIGMTLEPFASTFADIRYRPTQLGEDSAVLTISYYSDGQTRQETVPLSGQGGQGCLAMAPAFLEFGHVAIRDTKNLQLELSNPCAEALTFCGFSVGDLTPGMGVIDIQDSNGLANSVLQPAESGVIQVSCTPYISEEIQTDISICIENDANSPYKVPVTCNGVSGLVTTPDSLDFGTVSIAATKTMAFTIRNVGDGNVTIHSIALEEQLQTSSFSIQFSSELPFVLASGESETVEVRFAPVDGLLHENQVVILSNDSEHPILRVPVKAQGGN